MMNTCSSYANKSWRCVWHVWNPECQNLLNSSCSSSTLHCWSVHSWAFHNPSAADLMNAFEELQRWPIRRSDETPVAGYAPSRIWNSLMASTKKDTKSRTGRSNHYGLQLTTLHIAKIPFATKKSLPFSRTFQQPSHKCKSSQICKHGCLQRESWVK